MDSNKLVKDTYNQIANDFSRTRHYIWPCVKKFLDSVSQNSIGLEIGCGNGKNLMYRKDIKLKGIDICENFVNICKKKQLDVSYADMLNLPFPDNTFDFVFSIAVVHHLNTQKLRIQAINEMFRVCKPNAKIFILVWAFEQDVDSKRHFETCDEMVSWINREDGKTYYRYYHLYKKNELLEEIINSKNDYTLLDDFYEKSNWGIIISKN
jgi:tRNA (uracil-5-)-methyltransferase TRM9